MDELGAAMKHLVEAVTRTDSQFSSLAAPAARSRASASTAPEPAPEPAPAPAALAPALAAPATALKQAARAPGQLVCPVCQSLQSEESINRHLDSCLTRRDAGSQAPVVSPLKQPAVVSFFAAPQRPVAASQRLPQRQYSAMKDKHIKAELVKYGLRLGGPSGAQIKRLREFAMLYNASCDSGMPRSYADVAAEVSANEAAIEAARCTSSSGAGSAGSLEALYRRLARAAALRGSRRAARLSWDRVRELTRLWIAHPFTGGKAPSAPLAPYASAAGMDAGVRLDKQAPAPASPSPLVPAFDELGGATCENGADAGGDVDGAGSPALDNSALAPLHDASGSSMLTRARLSPLSLSLGAVEERAAGRSTDHTGDDACVTGRAYAATDEENVLAWTPERQSGGDGVRVSRLRRPSSRLQASAPSSDGSTREVVLVDETSPTCAVSRKRKRTDDFFDDGLRPQSKLAHLTPSQ